MFSLNISDDLNNSNKKEKTNCLKSKTFPNYLFLASIVIIIALIIIIIGILPKNNSNSKNTTYKE